MPEFGIDLEQVNIKDLGNLEHTVVAQNMIDMVRKTTGELKGYIKTINHSWRRTFAHLW